MPEKTPGARRRRRADVVVIIAAVYALLAAARLPPEMITGGGARDVASGGWLWAAYALGGVLGLAAVVVGLRRQALARVMAAAAGLLVLSGLLALRHITPLALVSLGATGLALLAASPFIGRMPTPEEEGKRR